MRKTGGTKRELPVLLPLVNDKQLEADSYEIRKHAENKAGQMLAEMAEKGERDPGRGGDRKSQSHAATVKSKLSDFGISKTQSSRWQQFFALPDEAKERVIKVCRVVGVCFRLPWLSYSVVTAGESGVMA